MKKIIRILIGVFTYLFLIYIITLLERSDPNANINNYVDALWYGIVTLTTVGYGDFYPVTMMGRIVGLIVIIGSIGVLGYLIGEISNRINNYMEKKKTGFFGTDFEEHYVIIGWSEFGRNVADQIFPSGHNIAFVSNSKNDLELIKDLYPHKQCFSMFADYHNMQAYQKVNIEKTKAVFVNFIEDTDTLVFVLNLKKDFPNLKIIVNCSNPELKGTLLASGIQHVVSRSEVASRLIASYLFEPHVAEYTEDLIASSTEHEEQDIQQFRIVEDNPYRGMPYFDAFVQMKKDINVILIGLVIDNKVVKNPSDDQIIEAGQYIIIISIGSSKKQLETLFKVKEGI